ncbi:MAG: CHAT domain-containing protein, partial [Cyanobacteriota bacterium]|nr:CHAT domain-containing protein [Cyanobacteriota bacterium]
MKMEQGIEKEFEGYFDREISKGSQNGEEIAQNLLDIRQKSQIKAAVLWAIPESEYLHLVLITPGKMPLVKDIDSIKRKNINRAVRSFHNEITNPRNLHTDSYLNQAQQLYNWIIKPFDEDLKAERIDTILFCLGKGLRTLPIAALHDGNQFLVEKYSLSIIPAFNLIDSNYTPIQDAKVLAMGASEFEMQGSLPAVPVELSTIVDAGVMENISTQNFSRGWPGELFLNQDFTLDNLRNQLKSKSFNIIHLATHAEFRP